MNRGFIHNTYINVKEKQELYLNSNVASSVSSVNIVKEKQELYLNKQPKSYHSCCHLR